MTELAPEYRRVLADLRARGGGSIREIAARLGDDAVDVEERLEWLRRRRYLRHNGVLGVWWIPSYYPKDGQWTPTRT